MTDITRFYHGQYPTRRDSYAILFPHSPRPSTTQTPSLPTSFNPTPNHLPLTPTPSNNSDESPKTDALTPIALPLSPLMVTSFNNPHPPPTPPPSSLDSLSDTSACSRSCKTKSPRIHRPAKTTLAKAIQLHWKSPLIDPALPLRRFGPPRRIHPQRSIFNSPFSFSPITHSSSATSKQRDLRRMEMLRKGAENSRRPAVEYSKARKEFYDARYEGMHAPYDRNQSLDYTPTSPRTYHPSTPSRFVIRIDARSYAQRVSCRSRSSRVELQVCNTPSTKSRVSEGVRGCVTPRPDLVETVTDVSFNDLDAVPDDHFQPDISAAEGIISQYDTPGMQPDVSPSSNAELDIEQLVNNLADEFGWL